MSESNKRSDLDIFGALRNRYQLPKFTLAFEVPNGTSRHKTNSIDALAVGCWETAGIQIIGHEVKVSRSDWQREMQMPLKADAWKQHCHQWYLVAMPGIAKLEELPPSWGLMELAGNGLRIRKPCEINKEPKPISSTLLAAIMRKLQNGSAAERDLQASYDRGWKDGLHTGQAQNNTDEQRLKREVEYEKREASSLREKIEKFERATGVCIGGGWRYPGVEGEAELFNLFRRVQRNNWSDLRTTMQGILNHLDAMDKGLAIAGSDQ